MSSPVPFVDVCGFPAPGEAVHPTARAAEHLKAAGWTPPEDRIADPHPHEMHSDGKTYWCEWCPYSYEAS